MELELTGKIIVRCDECDTDCEIDVDSLDEETYAYERNMGAEIEHDYIGECTCKFCGNNMRFTIKAFEYPEGALNYTDEESDGCELIETPEVVVNYYDYDFDPYEEDEIRNEVGGACLNINRILEDKDAIYEITPREFEELVAEVFSQQGYNVEITPATRDGGCDIIATREIHGIPYMILIECKRYSAGHKVDVQLVRSLLGVQSDRKANKAILVTSSLFTRDAQEFANRQDHLISLVDVNTLLNMIRNPNDN
ncbi:MAG: hypothetical protein APF81_22145 [Desulfosporosinus sp. BRH_c37]|nr:MAG: hypothetical protein APF81_22145 [Desulfosporosinus sp. BRH_c37]